MILNMLVYDSLIYLRLVKNGEINQEEFSGVIFRREITRKELDWGEFIKTGGFTGGNFLSSYF